MESRETGSGVPLCDCFFERLAGFSDNAKGRTEANRDWIVEFARAWPSYGRSCLASARVVRVSRTPPVIRTCVALVNRIADHWRWQPR